MRGICTMTAAAGFERAWAVLEPGAQRSLQLAYASLAAGGLACGAALIDASGVVVADGRNRAYDSPGGPRPVHLHALVVPGAVLHVHFGLSTIPRSSVTRNWSPTR
jgi:hypothetical protein